MIEELTRSEMDRLTRAGVRVEEWTPEDVRAGLEELTIRTEVARVLVVNPDGPVGRRIVERAIRWW